MSKKQNKPVKSPASKFGQIIGEVFESVVLDVISDYLTMTYPDYQLLQPDEGKRLIKLEMLGGLPRQMDNVIIAKATGQPVALFETKWLKDARHHNDKGAWILQLREVKKRYATIRGATAVLLGHWTEGVGMMLFNEGGVKMVLVATDEQVYSTLQQPLDQFLGENSFQLDVATMRESYPRPDALLAMLTDLQDNKRLIPIARSWLKFERQSIDGQTVQGADLIQMALDDLLQPASETNRVTRIEIALHIDAGNIIYAEFIDQESAMAFIQDYANDPEAIQKRIDPFYIEDDPD